MSLTRKPAIGERLLSPVGAPYTVTGFRERFPDICLIRSESGHETQFIWRFDSGLNNHFSHEIGEKP